MDAPSGLMRVGASPGASVWLRKCSAVFLAAWGLGTWLLAHETAGGLSPLEAESVLIIALSPLVGTPLSTSAKFAIVGKSPLTGRICDALSSSHFALAAKRLGVDAIVINGACAEPSIVFVEGCEHGPPRVWWQPADALWGLPARAAEDQIRSRHGANWQVAAIGPAGERLIPLATISHDGRHAGRGGLGAILGSKRIKAIAVRGSQRTPLADAPATVDLARRISGLSFGPATAKYRELGTEANLLVFNRFAILPARNFQASPSYGAEPKKSGLSPVFGESLDYISTSACVTCEDGHVGTLTAGCPYLGVIVNPPQPPRQN